ncbi:MAG: ATP-binding protein [Candidatus Omnitrophica bacterium]|nr:ATP-binding protein [Candidatus Omnitrophota bacterium]
MTVTKIVDDNIPSKLDLVPGFITAVLEKLQVLHLDEDEVFALKLCLYEALVNAIKHGNKEKSDQAVHVIVKTNKKKIILEVTDQGHGFDFTRIPNPTTEENIGKFHGRGVYLIQNSMDSVKFLNGGRTIQMVKVIK